MPRMKIFNTSEQNAYELPPALSSIDRKKYFTIPAAFKSLLDDLRAPTNKVCFLVTAGYFKARHRFFSRQFHQKDIEFVASQIAVDPQSVNLDIYNKSTYRRHQILILNHFGFSPFDDQSRDFTKNEISTMVKVQFRPKIILLEIIQKLRRRKIALPTYNVLADMVVSAINNHQLELNKMIKSNLTEAQKTKLDVLLEQESGTGSEDKWRYQITLLKKPSQSIRPTKIKSNLTDFNDLLAIYLEIKPVVDHMALSHECLRYYAKSVLKSQVHQINRRSSETRYLHLMAFIVYQTFKLQDVLIDTLVLAIQGAKNATEKEHQEVYYQAREGRDLAMKSFVTDLQKSFSDKITKIKDMISNPTLSAEQKILAIDLILQSSESTGLTSVHQTVDTIQKGNDYYDLVEDRSLKMQNRVADIVRHTVFDATCEDTVLLEAIVHYQKKSGSVDKNVPISFLTPEEQMLIFSRPLNPVFLILSIPKNTAL